MFLVFVLSFCVCYHNLCYHFICYYCYIQIFCFTIFMLSFLMSYIFYVFFFMSSFLCYDYYVLFFHNFLSSLTPPPPPFHFCPENVTHSFFGDPRYWVLTSSTQTCLFLRKYRLKNKSKRE
jgi:hypothetical protein